MFRLVLEGVDEALLPFDALGPLAVEGRARPPDAFAPPYGSLGLLRLAPLALLLLARPLRL